MSEIIIYHNPRCSKSRQTLALLEENGVNPTIKEYLKDSPTEAELMLILAKLGGDISKMIRPKEPEYLEQGLSATSTDAEIIKAIHNSPKLLERPIVINGNKAIIGRPPENILNIL